MPQLPATGMNADEFFAFIRTRDERWELVDGEAVMMAGADQRRQAISANILASLRMQLRGGKCRATAARTGVSSIPGTIRYPDLVVDCGGYDELSMIATEPTVVIEVLSADTRAFDTHLKLFEYKSIDGVAFVLLVDAENTKALLHRRDPHGWRVTMHDSMATVIEFPNIAASLAISDIYYGVDTGRE